MLPRCYETMSEKYQLKILHSFYYYFIEIKNNRMRDFWQRFCQGFDADYLCLIRSVTSIITSTYHSKHFLIVLILIEYPVRTELACSVI